MRALQTRARRFPHEMGSRASLHSATAWHDWFETDTFHTIRVTPGIWSTGESVSADGPTDEQTGDDAPLAPLIEVLDHGREGMPRWVVADAAPGLHARGFSVAQPPTAAPAGSCPISVHLYARLRDYLGEDLRDWTLLLMAGPRASATEARAALLHASAQSPRPHVLLTLRAESNGGAGFVREAGAVYGAEPVRAGLRAAADRYGRRPSSQARGARGRVHTHRTTCGGRASPSRRGRRAHTAGPARSCRPHADHPWTRHAGAREGEPCGPGPRGRRYGCRNRFGRGVDGDARIWQAAARTDAGRLTEAESLCRAALAAGSLDSPTRARAQATLARVLLWQARFSEAAALDLTVEQEHDPDAPSVCFVGATAVRVLIANGRLFEAGLRARHLIADDRPARWRG